MTHPGAAGRTMESFLEQVQQRAGLADSIEADRLVRGTISALSERLARGQIDHLSPALPPELHEELRRYAGQAKSFDKTTFLDRVSGEIDTVDQREAERQVRAVLTVLREWAPAGEIDDTVQQLPPDLSEMFE